MAIIFDTTVSGSDSNAYPTVIEYSQYWENRGIDVSCFTDAELQIRIINATDYFEQNYVPVSGLKAVSGQSLNYPVSGGFYKDGSAQPDDEIIPQVKNAVCELGEYFKKGALQPEEGRNKKSQKFEGLGEIVYQDNTSNTARKFPKVDRILDGIAKREGASNCVRLIR